MQNICEGLLKICPELKYVNGYIIFGSLSDVPPYNQSYYINWRTDSDDYSEVNTKAKDIEKYITNILKQYTSPSPPPHGYFKIKSRTIEFQLTTQDIVDTILYNIDKANQLKDFSI